MDFVTVLERSSLPLSQRRNNARRNNRREDDDGQNFEHYQENAGGGGQRHSGHAYNIICQWEPFREQILLHWSRLTPFEVDSVGPHRSKLAQLIEVKYGVPAHLAENYLRNFERTLPLI